MKPGFGYIPVESRHPLKGLNTSVPPTQLDPSYSPLMSNMFIRDGEVYKRFGYTELVDQALDGTVMELIDFQLPDGTREFVALTSTRQYLYNDGGGTWDDITATAQLHAITDADADTDWVEITGDHTGLFVVGASYIIAGSTDNDGTYVVTGVALVAGSTRITIAAASLTSDTADGTVEGVFYPITGVNTVTKTFTVLGNHAAVLPVGSSIIVTDFAANNGEYTVVLATNVVGDTTIEVSEVIPNAGVAGNIHAIKELTTIEGDTIDWVVGTDTNTHRLYFTNGRDRVRFWNGTDARFLIWHPEHTDFVTCKTISVFFSMMLLGNVTYAANEPKLIAWSDTADFENWTTGNAGTLLIPELSGSIQATKQLGDRMIVYSDDSIAGLMFVGGSVVISSEVLIPDGVRLVSPRGVVSFGAAHLFASQDNIYFFEGVRGLRAVGDNIRALYKQDINFEYANRLFGFNDVAKRTIFVVVPVVVDTATPANDSSVVYILDYNVFDLREFKWSRTNYIHPPRALGFFERQSSDTWDDWLALGVAWEDLDRIWASEGSQIGFPVRVMGAWSRVYLMDDSVRTDDDSNVLAWYETRDFVIPTGDLSMLGRWGEIEADLAGTEVEVYYSIDQGGSWTLVDTRSLGADFGHYSFPIDVVSRTLRIRFKSESAYFSFRWARAWVKPGAAR